MYKCDFCGTTIHEGQHRVERFQFTFCSYICLESKCAAMEPQGFENLQQHTRVIAKPEPPTTRLNRP